MQPISLEEIEAFVAENIPAFHQNRIEKIKGLRLKTVLRRKNPYLFKVKAIKNVNGTALAGAACKAVRVTPTAAAPAAPQSAAGSR